jgi:hypothetical protein
LRQTRVHGLRRGEPANIVSVVVAVQLFEAAVP